MRCPNCGYISFDYLDECRKCGGDLRAYKEEKGIRVPKPSGIEAPPPPVEEPSISLEEAPLLTPETEAKDIPFALKEEEREEYEALSFLETPPEEHRIPPGGERDLQEVELEEAIEVPAIEVPEEAEPAPSPTILEEEELEAIEFTLPPSIVEKPVEKPPLEAVWSASKEKIDETTLPKAGFWIRFLAFLIDYALLNFAGAILAYGVYAVVGLGSLFSGGFTEEMTYLALGVILPMLVVINIAYYTIFVGWRGQTPGKILLKLKIIPEKREEMTYGRAFLRWVGYLISTILLGFGYLMIAFTRQKQGLHDKIASTFVVKI